MREHHDMNKPALVIYHANCPDGLVAGWAAWRCLGPEAEYLPMQYGQMPPDVTGRDVYVVDFSFPREVTLRMADQAEGVTILDHHKTALCEYVCLLHERLHIELDMERSGAALAWDYFQGGKRPFVVEYTQDRDLWTWALPQSKEINAALGTATAFEDIERLLERGKEAAAEAGRMVLAFQQRMIDAAKRDAHQRTFLGYQVLLCNTASAIASEVGAVLSQGYPFAVLWRQLADGRFNYSLRSTSEGRDVSELARAFGGGGHRNAAGFTHSAAPWGLTFPLESDTERVKWSLLDERDA